MCQQYRHLLYCLPLLAVRNNRSKTPLRCGFEDIPLCSIWSDFSVDRWLFRLFLQWLVRDAAAHSPCPDGFGQGGLSGEALCSQRGKK
jgi:hypothetical protein